MDMLTVSVDLTTISYIVNFKGSTLVTGGNAFLLGIYYLYKNEQTEKIHGTYLN